MQIAMMMGLAVGLSMDAFSVAVAVGVALGKLTGRQLFRLGWHFGLFQFFMPLIGWFGGAAAGAVITRVDHWLALGLLSYIGGRMLVSAIRHDEEEVRGDPTRGLSLVILSGATSIDALATGLSMRAMDVNVWVACTIIGVLTAGLTALGMLLGAAGRTKLGPYAKALGGVVLIAIGIRVVVVHLSS